MVIFLRIKFAISSTFLNHTCWLKEVRVTSIYWHIKMRRICMRYFSIQVGVADLSFKEGGPYVPVHIGGSIMTIRYSHIHALRLK